jgi:effector-binding domain-containing protein
MLIVGLLCTIMIWQWHISRVEHPKYQVTAVNQNIELRQYQPMIVAQVQVTGSREQAIRQGFKLLAKYIFGGNNSQQKIAMTAPVMQQKNSNQWIVQFVMPSQYQLKDLPKPDDSKVQFKTLPIQKIAAIRFAGFNNDSNLVEHQKQLANYLHQQNIKFNDAPIYAFYNPPWTLPFLRRNEVMLSYQP